MDAEKSIEFFANAMKEDSHSRISFMQNKLDELKKAEFSNARNEAERQAELIMENGMKKTVSESANEISAAENARRTELARLREKIANDVFERAKEKLSKFTETDDYRKFIDSRLDEIEKYFSGTAFTIYCKKADDTVKNAVKEKFGGSVKVEESGEIAIGGCKAMAADGHIVADNTLDTKLYEQKDWFYENSGLTVE